MNLGLSIFTSLSCRTHERYMKALWMKIRILGYVTTIHVSLLLRHNHTHMLVMKKWEKWKLDVNENLCDCIYYGRKCVCVEHNLPNIIWYFSNMVDVWMYWLCTHSQNFPISSPYSRINPLTNTLEHWKNC